MNSMTWPALAMPFFIAGCAATEQIRENKDNVNLNMPGATLREIFEKIEHQTGVMIAKSCSCGMLQEVIDRRGRGIVCHDIPLGKAVILTFVPLSIYSHCGQWTREGRVLRLYCGLRSPDPLPPDVQKAHRLIELIGSQDAEERARSREALLNLGDAADCVLEEAVHHPDPWVATRAKEAIFRRGEKDQTSPED